MINSILNILWNWHFVIEKAREIVVPKIMSKLYTLEEIKLQNGKNGAKTWIVIHDCVYDVTDYLEDVSVFFDLCVNWNYSKFLKSFRMFDITTRYNSYCHWKKKNKLWILAPRRRRIDFGQCRTRLYKRVWWFWSFQRCKTNSEEIQNRWTCWGKTPGTLYLKSDWNAIQ